MSFRNLYILLFFFLSCSLKAQNTQWLNFTYGEAITAIAEAPGTMWIGTTGGLVEVDKLTQTPVFYNKANSGLPANRISDVAVDQLGNAWISTETGGLVKYNESGWTVYNTSNSGLPDDNLREIAISPAGEIWICTTSKGLVKFHNGQWTVYNKSNSDIPNDSPSLVTIAPDGSKWMVSQYMLVKFDDVQWTVTTFAPGIIISIAIDQDNIVWAATKGDFGQAQGVRKFDGANWTAYDMENSNMLYDLVTAVAIDRENKPWIFASRPFDFNPDSCTLSRLEGTVWIHESIAVPGGYFGNVNHIYFDEENTAWLGSGNYGLAVSDGNGYNKVATSNSGLTDNFSYDLVFDPQQNLWLSNNHGIAHFDGTSWQRFDSTDLEPLKYGISAFTVDRAGNKWMALYGAGLAKWDGTSVTVYTQAEMGLQFEVIYDLVADNNNVLWMSTYNFGIIKYDGASFTNYNTNTSPIPANYINGLYTGTDNSLWFSGGFPGVTQFDGINWNRHYDTSNPNAMQQIKTIAIDSGNTLWLGGPYLYRQTGNDWIIYSPGVNSIPDLHISTLAVDHDNSLWVGSVGIYGGLGKMKDNNWQTFRASSSKLTEDHITQVVIDKKGNKWIATYEGITVYNEQGISLGMDKIVQKQLEHAVFPNPCSSKAILSIPSFSGTGMLWFSLYDLLGQELLKLPVTGIKTDIDRGSLQSGVYFYNITDGKGTLATGKLIMY